MSNVDRTPFNTVPKEWAFDPEIGPFIQELWTLSGSYAPGQAGMMM